LNNIKLFITDIDGVWTDGSMYYDNQNNEFKRFSTYDSAGVLFLNEINIPTIIITGEDNNIVKRRAKKLGIDQVYMGIKNKLEKVNEIILNKNINLSEIAFIGDDINDYALLKSVGLSAAPINAPIYIKEIVNWVLPIKGGEGAYRYFVEKFLKETNQLNRVINTILNDKYNFNNFSQ
jgi:3-deoxy-D-manno-octulosonate 8-phosphate phosphatase (KDO 8-P phosphatase)